MKTVGKGKQPFFFFFFFARTVTNFDLNRVYLESACIVDKLDSVRLRLPAFTSSFDTLNCVYFLDGIFGSPLNIASSVPNFLAGCRTPLTVRSNANSRLHASSMPRKTNWFLDQRSVGTPGASKELYKTKSDLSLHV